MREGHAVNGRHAARHVETPPRQWMGTSNRAAGEVRRVHSGDGIWQTPTPEEDDSSCLTSPSPCLPLAPLLCRRAHRPQMALPVAFPSPHPQTLDPPRRAASRPPVLPEPQQQPITHGGPRRCPWAVHHSPSHLRCAAAFVGGVRHERGHIVPILTTSSTRASPVRSRCGPARGR